MKSLVDMISKYVFNDMEIPEDLLYEFSTEAAQIVEMHNPDSIPEEFWKLENYVELYWRSRQFIHEKNNIRIFQMGQLLSHTNMIRIWSERIEQETSLDEYARMFQDKYLFFNCISNDYGITHKELAEQMSISVSALSQFVNKTKSLGFFMSRAMGREKHYYLTDKGNQLLRLMKKNSTPPHYKYTKLLGALDNLNDIVSNDPLYKAIIGWNNGFITEKIYALNKTKVFTDYNLILNISANINISEDNSEEEEWAKNLNAITSNKIS